MAKGGVNKVIIIGNLGADPEVRYMPSGNAVANIRVATHEQWKDRNTGENQEHTEWHRIAMFGKLGEIAGQYLRKGSKVYIEGRLRTRKWQDQSGQDRYSTEIVTDQMQMLDSRGAGGGNEFEQGYGAPARPAAPAANAPQRGAPYPQSDFDSGYEYPPAQPTTPVVPSAGASQRGNSPYPASGFDQGYGQPARPTAPAAPSTGVPQRDNPPYPASGFDQGYGQPTQSAAPAAPSAGAPQRGSAPRSPAVDEILDDEIPF